jgi:predicted negative regulator of RcsB-dependent stress response
LSYTTDDEQVEAIKRWWKDNGMAIVAGIVIGLGAIIGWRTWTGHRDTVAAEASSIFDQALSSAAAGQADNVIAQVQVLNDTYASTPYAALGALIAAKALHDTGKSDEAMAALTRAIATAPDPAIARIAALRLARIQVAGGLLDEAAKTVADHDSSPALRGDFAVVRGDIAMARGDIPGARQAYEQALASGTGLAELIRLKLETLPAAES